MNSNHKNGGNKTPFEDDLGKISQAYGQITPEEPPELLDQAILNSAHRAVEKQSHWMQFGWLHGLTTAAVVVLAVSIILHQSEPAPVFEDDILSSTPPQAAPREAPEKESAEPVMESHREMRLRTEPLDNDSAENGLVAEEVKLHPAEVMADAPQASAVLKQAGPASTSEPDKSDLSAETMTVPEAAYEPGAEDELAAIIRLKEAGDESWREALEQFQQRYPDYPLPEGLED